MQKLLIDYAVPGTEKNKQSIKVQLDCKMIKSYTKLNKIKQTKNLDLLSRGLSWITVTET